MITTNKCRYLLRVLTASLLLGLADQLPAQTFKLLYRFLDASSQAGLVLSGNTLYGTAGISGSGDVGTVFAVNTDGTGFRAHHFFAVSDGFNPRGLVLSGNTLYGTTLAAGIFGSGTVFAINTDLTGFTTLYNFSGSDGSRPGVSTLILSGGTLYGTTGSGGFGYEPGVAGGYGTVFAINTDGTGFTTLYNFTGATDGANPNGGLVLSSNTLYGTAIRGSSGSGTVFNVNTDGTGFTTLYSFKPSTNGTNSDGAGPWGSLILSGNTLYGTAQRGGSADAGTVFKLNTDGTGFAILHTFTGYNSKDGAFPGPGLVLSGSTLYGTTAAGGIYEKNTGGGYGLDGQGTVFALNTDGTGFTVLHRFSGGDGIFPNAPLLLSGNTLYGTTVFGGRMDGRGTIFSISFTPQLSITASEQNVILAWPTNYAGFDYSGYALQSTTNLGSSAVWTTVSPAPVIINGQNTVTNPIAGTRKFYRLSQ